MKNKIAIILRKVGIVTIIIGIAYAFYNAVSNIVTNYGMINDTLSIAGIFFSSLLTFGISGIFIIGFSEIIELLQRLVDNKTNHEETPGIERETEKQ